jgi:hypothetical protein
MLKLMLEFFERKNPMLTAEALGQLRMLSMLKDSLDVVDFMIFIEDKLGLETQFDLNEVRTSFINSNFGELACEILKLLPERGVATP